MLMMIMNILRPLSWTLFLVTNIESRCVLIIIHQYAFCALTLLVEQQKWRPACKRTRCWFVDGDILTGASHML